MKHRTRLTLVLLTASLLLLAAGTVWAQGQTPITWAVIRRLTVTNKADFLVSVDMNNHAITNIGAAGTDFAANGSLTTAEDVTSTDDLIAGDDLAVTDDAVITGSLTAADVTAADVTASDWLHLTASATVAVGAGATITPLGSYQPITSTAEVTTSTSTAIAAGSAAGDILILRNANASDPINVDGAGGNVECGANVALGANDILTLLWNGSDWSCLALRDN